MKNAKKILKALAGKKVLVIGDVILDRYIWGAAERISPEAPVPIITVAKEECKLGGAANVARNLKSVGCTPILVGVIGKDGAGQQLKQALEAEGISAGHLVIDPHRPTSVKTRVIAQKQQLMRIDQEEIQNLNARQEKDMLHRITAFGGLVSAVVISDYGKGVISPGLMELLVPRLQPFRVPVCVDPKERNFAFYQDVTVVTPNLREAAYGSGVAITDPASLKKAAGVLINSLRLEYCLITQGEQGLTLFDREHTAHHLDAWQKEEVFDVTGAGDTVISLLAASLAGGAAMKEAAAIANCAAGLVVRVVGCGAVTARELETALAE
jgi:D-beta-D-heptose 7-phosphate kinase/D-beta-D-heptose 1-phosphate adenosyltransferase